jgi:hypothetical protein
MSGGKRLAIVSFGTLDFDLVDDKSWPIFVTLYCHTLQEFVVCEQTDSNL